MNDLITIITSRGRRLTKAWNGDTGEIESYQEARQIKVEEREVGDIFSLRSLLEELECRPNSCIIRGKYVGDERSAELMPGLVDQDRKRKPDAKAPDEGYTLRRLVLFPDRKLHYIMLDIDGFVPTGVDPISDPVSAIDQYIRTKLPTCFHDVTYCWQLSGSAGHDSAKGVLKAHAYFWLKTPHTGESLEAWGNSLNAGQTEKVVDVTVFRPVQANYTAFPVFINGAKDPVPVRSGIEQSIFSDEVDLVIDPSVIKSARSERKLREDMVDQCNKDGLIGLFHRTYTIEEVVERWLSDVFEFVTENRLNWLLSESGAKEGAGVTSNRQGIFNTHNGDPMNGRATNQWDLVRHYKFGDLDTEVDDLLREDVNLLPSQAAMFEFVKDLPEIREALRVENAKACLTYKERITTIEDVKELEEYVETEISSAKDLSTVDVASLEDAIMSRFKTLGVKLRVNAVRDLMRPKKKSTFDAPTEPWCEPYVWCNFEDRFINTETQQSLTVQAFNMTHGRDVKGRWLYGDSDMSMPAHQVAINEVQIPIVDKRMYLPWAEKFFKHNGQECLNTYRHDLVPSSLLPNQWTKHDRSAVEVVENHFRNILGDSADVVLQWIAHNVQNPGVKIRWSILIQGPEGIGKTTIGDMLALIIGPENVGTPNGDVISGTFNSWAEGKCINILEELKIDGHSKFDIVNKLKPLHTNDVIHVHHKGLKSYDAINTVNYIAFTNHTDAIPIEEGDRRWYVIFTKQSSRAQMLEEGMGSEYYSRLQKAIRDHRAAIRGYFLDMDCSKLDISGAPPMTMAKRIMCESNESDEMHAVRDAIARGFIGVSEDVVSVRHLRFALSEYGVELAPRQCGWIMRRLGYESPKDAVVWNEIERTRVWVKDRSRVFDLPYIRKKLMDTLHSEDDLI